MEECCPFLQGSGNIAEEQARRKKELETGGMCSEILSSGPDFIVYMDSQKLCFSEQDLPKIKPVTNLSIDREGIAFTPS